MTMRDELNRSGPVIDSLNAAIRENPLAAGLIGAGVAWMLLSSNGLGVLAGAAKGAAKSAGSTAAMAGSAMASDIAKAGSNAATGIKEVAGSVASIVPDLSIPDTDKVYSAVDDAKSAVGGLIDSVSEKGREYGGFVQSKLSNTLERQPLLLGAIGLAIGAGIASTFASTEMEEEWMGEKGAAAREHLQSVTDEVKDRARTVISDVKDEVNRQGLTPDAAKAAATDITGKLTNVADAVRESVTQSVTARG